METIQNITEFLIKNPWVLYPFAVVLFTALTLKYLFKATPKWFKIAVSVFWGVLLGVLTYMTSEVNPMIIVFGFGFSVYFYEKILKKIKSFNYDNGKGLLK